MTAQMTTTLASQADLSIQQQTGAVGSIESTTKWAVCTGAPCSGKTTTLEGVQSRAGFVCVPEHARVFAERMMAERGCTIAELRHDLEGNFQREVFAGKVSVEESVDRESVVFFDRALPDSIAYARVAGLSSVEIEEMRRACEKVRYQHVLLFERLPSDVAAVALELDPVRTEDEAAAERIENELLRVYQEELGYDVIRVPFMSVEDRVAFVLEACGLRSSLD